jgi:hypothetical protein
VGGGLVTPSPTPRSIAGRGSSGPSGLVTVVTGTLVAIGVLALVVMSIVLAARRPRAMSPAVVLRP